MVHILDVYKRQPVMIQLIKICGLPVERYFNPEIVREESEQRQRVSHKLKLCPEEYLPIIEGAIDGDVYKRQKYNGFHNNHTEYLNTIQKIRTDPFQQIC